ncbi:hypothetical protein [Streptomyces sp. G-G2]|uniref:hypothetical protein n=1 Tax=Streptomyces sp. G-G2 TaxID=3046201 RepID=UPI0024B8D218|nr:hypothetical protein [Streptomyces sp. G-G2]MDJ0380710.1 hypothetical protein [Streptomyces sp. G-G2]
MALSSKWQTLLGEDGVGMTLASAATPPGGGGPDLKADEGPWTSAGNIAGALRTSSATAVTELGAASEGVTGGTTGFASTGALTEILGTWTARFGAVRDECGRLDGALKSTGRDFGEREIATKQKFSQAVIEQPKNRG